MAGEGCAADAPTGSVERQQSMTRHREFGLYASRLRHHPAEQSNATHAPASDFPGVGDEAEEEEHEEYQEYHQYDQGYDPDPLPISQASRDSSRGPVQNSTSNSNDYYLYDRPIRPRQHALPPSNTLASVASCETDNSYDDFDDAFGAPSPERRPAAGPRDTDRFTSKWDASSGRAPQLPPLPISPISPRWDSLAHNRAFIYDPPALADGPTAVTADSPIAPTSPTSPTFRSFPILSSPSPRPLAQEYDTPLAEFAPLHKQHALPPSPMTTPQNFSTKMFRPDSRQASEGSVENFSRPRKPSIRSNYQDVSAPPSRPRTATITENDSHPDSTNTISSVPPSLNAWSRSRGLSVSSNKSSSTFASINNSLSQRPSNDHLRNVRNGPSNATSSPAMTTPSSAASVPPPSFRFPRHHDQPPPPWLADDELRSSFRSQLTASSAQGTLFTANGTERSSVLTKTSSITSSSLNGYYFGPNGIGGAGSATDEGLSVEDVMGMYEKGFDDSGMEDNDRDLGHDEDTKEIDMDHGYHGYSVSRPGTPKSDFERQGSRVLEAMADPLPMPARPFAPGAGDEPHVLRDSGAFFRNSGLPSSLPKEIGLSLAEEAMKADKRKEEKEKSRIIESVSADEEENGKVKHDSAKSLDNDNGERYDDDPSRLDDNRGHYRDISDRTTTPSLELSQPLQASPEPTVAPNLSPSPPPPSQTPLPAGSLEEEEIPGSRDRYGFKKQNQYITREQYDAWDATYSEYLARRRKKWTAYLKDSGLMTDHPSRFPPASAKTKRFIRKGIPPDWRGAAWFYYAGGPAILAKHPGVYDDLVRRADRGEVKEVCKEDIERDLYRTFPDNIKFRRRGGPFPHAAGSERSSAVNTSATHSRSDSTQSVDSALQPAESEPRIIQSLRRVLYAFAIYNPRIGYCQSLNFLAGLLLLFVDSEEQAFWLLNVITRVYLPGTHEMSLEGSKIDISVLMAELRTCIPSVWAKISEEGGSGANGHKRVIAARKHSRRDRAAAAAAAADRLPPITLALTAWFMSCFIGTLPIESTLRVWDVFFYEGSRTLFRVALAVFKIGESEIRAVSDPMEMFGVVQSLPRRLLDANALMDCCFRRRSGFGHLTTEAVEEKRAERREKERRERERAMRGPEEVSLGGKAALTGAGDLAAGESKTGDTVRRKGTLFGRKKERERPRLADA
ncbi:GTPase-activating protein gyp3 [Pleurostoma richardsiae]|uniref:GTPase-activating protein gyp3 n=1 Tax=Pleurostoma richardsiae TaxID=41990 RepID=A0AA38RHY2_9PEZI|nr:GTPase-activating protein gyp3 [Pleurostoma richardsiae]